MPVDEEGRRFCDHCGIRMKLGGIGVFEEGQVRARRANFRDDTYYCGERCLSDRLLGAREGDDPAVALQRKVEALEDRIDALREESAGNRAIADHLDGVLGRIEDEQLTRAISDDSRGTRLRALLHNTRIFVRAHRSEYYVLRRRGSSWN